jgi:hypothetical protein
VARFDWYQATVRGSVPDVRAVLSDLAPGEWEPLRKAPHGYAFGDRLVDQDGQVAAVWWGGAHEHPHVVISGERAQAGAELLRTHLPDHSVSRVDSCIDYAEPGAYDRLQGIALGVAQERGVRVGTAGDHLLTMQGRTLYLGAASSHTRLRLYDKAAELRAQFDRDPVRLATVPEHLARLEAQVRPQTPEAKRKAAQLDPLSVMGSAAWMRVLMRQVADLELEPFQAGTVWRQSDDDRAYAALMAQYGGLLRRIREDLGSWECVGAQIGHDLAMRDRMAERIRRTKR